MLKANIKQVIAHLQQMAEEGSVFDLQNIELRISTPLELDLKATAMMEIQGKPRQIMKNGEFCTVVMRLRRKNYKR